VDRKTGTAVYAACSIVSGLLFFGTGTSAHKAFASEDSRNGPQHAPITLVVIDSCRATMVFSDNGAALPIIWETRPILNKDGRPTGRCEAWDYDQRGSIVGRDALGREWAVDFGTDVIGMLKGIFMWLAFLSAAMALYYLTGRLGVERMRAAILILDIPPEPWADPRNSLIR
jgi:hypothetical protein